MYLGKINRNISFVWILISKNVETQKAKVEPANPIFSKNNK